MIPVGAAHPIAKGTAAAGSSSIANDRRVIVAPAAWKSLMSVFKAVSAPSIRTALFAAILTLTAFGTAALGWRAAQDWQSLEGAHAAQAADAGGNRFIAGLFEVLMERLATNNALQAPLPAGPEVLAEIERRRAAVRTNFAPGRAALAARDFPGRVALLAALDTALAKAEALRSAADTAIRKPVAERDAALRRDFIPGITASVNAALDVWFAAVHAVATDDPKLTRLAMVKELGWRLRDTAGFERSNVAAAISAGQPVAADRMAANAAIRSRVDLLWSQLRNLAPADATTHPAIRLAMDTAQRGYFDGFRGLADRMVQAGAEAPGGRYPMPPASFVETTTEQLGTLLGVLYAAAEASEARAGSIVTERETDLYAALGLLVTGLVVAGLATGIVLRRVTGPLGALEAATTRLATGDLSVEVPGTERPDEMGRLASAIRVLHAGLSEKARMQLAQAGEAARAEAEKREAVQRMADQVETAARVAVEHIGARSVEMAADARALAGTAGEVAHSAGLVTATARQVLADTEAGAAATEELAASIREVAGQVEGATAAARRAVDRTSSSQAAIGGLAVAASRIGDVVRLIADIAGRTNLLALNATIEAARAGEAGKGFAVVASEVKALATQTAKATEDISRQVQEIGAATTGAVAAVGEIAEAIRETDAAAGAIAAVIDQQAKATSEIAETVARTATAARDVSLRIAEVTAAVADAGARATAVGAAAAEAEAATAALQVTIVGIIRTATPEADRRTEPRQPGQGRRATLELAGGRAVTGELANIAQGGAAVLLPAGTPMAAGEAPATLRIDGIGQPLAGTVLTAEAEPGGVRVRLRFRAPELAAQALAPLLHARPTAAAA